MSKRGDIIVTCDICDHSQYKYSELADDGSRWRGGDAFDWMCVKGKDVCPRCRHAVATALRLGIAEGLQWPDDKESTEVGTSVFCPNCGRVVSSGELCGECGLYRRLP